MRHPSCRELYDHWNRLRGAAPAPRRSDIEPRLLRDILADTLILEVDEAGIYRYRLAGTAICAAYCKEMKGQDFLAAFSAADRERLGPLLRALSDTATPVSFAMSTQARGFRLEFEGILLPLRHAGSRYDRVIGVLAPLTRPYWLGTVPIGGQELTGVRRYAERRSDRRLGIAGGTSTATAIPDRKRPALVLLEGGKT